MSNRDFVVCSLCYPGVSTEGDSEEGDDGVTVHAAGVHRPPVLQVLMKDSHSTSLLLFPESFCSSLELRDKLVVGWGEDRGMMNRSSGIL